MQKSLAISGIQHISEVYDRNWFALRNFHCHWFEDSHILNDYLHHQEEGVDEYLQALKAATPLTSRLASWLTPKRLMKENVFRPLARSTPDATLYWIENDNDLRISAFYKDRASFGRIPDWDSEIPEPPDWYNYVRLDHGYDEDKPVSELGLEDMQAAAAFRGGACISQEMTLGDLYTPLGWRCAFGHEFEATPNLILKGGHWCPDCAPPAWNYDQQARRSPFLAQVWYQHHDRDEDAYYPPECVYDTQQP